MYFWFLFLAVLEIQDNIQEVKQKVLLFHALTLALDLEFHAQKYNKSSFDDL